MAASPDYKVYSLTHYAEEDQKKHFTFSIRLSVTFQYSESLTEKSDGDARG